MNILAKDTKTVYIVPYSTSTEITKEINGKTIRTGEREQKYTTPFVMNAYVSSPKGLATVDINGINVPEQRLMVVDFDKDYEPTGVTGVTGATGATGSTGAYEEETPIKEADLVLIPKSRLSQSEETIIELLLDNDGSLSTFAKEHFYAYRIANTSGYDYHYQFTITRIKF